MSISLDLGCGANPKNPFGAEEVYGIDIRDLGNAKIFVADLNVERIPFPDNSFDSVTAFDFIEHVPRILYTPARRFPFVELMNQIHRVLKAGGLFLSFTPAFPRAAAWRDPTHVNVITDQTFELYFCQPDLMAKIYGFDGAFKLEQQYWHENQIHLVTTLRKI